MPDSNVRRRKYDTYVAMIKNSVGTKMFRNFFVEFIDSGEQKDVYRDGQVSCASHTSSILVLNQYLPRVRAEVVETIKMMLQHGWVLTDTPKTGDVIHWEKNELFSNEHLGFYIDEATAISNSPEDRHPILHPKTYNDTRQIIGYYTRDYETDL